MGRQLDDERVREIGEKLLVLAGELERYTESLEPLDDPALVPGWSNKIRVGSSSVPTTSCIILHGRAAN